MEKTNEEIYIESRLGHDNPFKVPEGYFEHFADKFMQELPDEDKKPTGEKDKQPSWIVRLRPILYAAACICLFVFGTALYFQQSTTETDAVEQAFVAQDNSKNDDVYFEEAADYVMMDNHDIYACLMNE